MGGAEEPAPEGPTQDWGRWLARAVVLVGVALPTARMVHLARMSEAMQYNDYWPMIGSVLEEDGSVRWAGLMESRLDHPVVLPKLTFLANLAATDGSNQGQIVVAIALGLALVGLVGLLARATTGIGRWGRVSVTVASAFIAFAPMGAWSFVKAMSGTAWLSAQVLAVAAILATVHRRRWLAPGLAVLATISYGTGLLAWPAVLLTSVLRDRGIRRSQWPTWAAAAATGAAYVRWYAVDRTPRDADAATPVQLVRRTAGLVIGPLSDGPNLVVVAVLGGVVIASVVAGRRRLEALAPWLGVLTLGGGGAALIARTRQVLGQAGEGESAFGEGLPARYWPVVALVWIGLTGLVVAAVGRRPWSPVVAIPLAALCLTGAPGVVEPLRPSTDRHEALAVAMHLDLADGRRVGGGRQPMPAVTDRLRAAGHVPFDGSFHLGCDMLGRRIEVRRALPPGVEGEVRLEPAINLMQPLQLVGELRTDGAVECVVVVDAEGRVVGAGPAHEWEPGTWSLRALAAPDYFLDVAVRLEADGPFHVVPRDSG